MAWAAAAACPSFALETLLGGNAFALPLSDAAGGEIGQFVQGAFGQAERHAEGAGREEGDRGAGDPAVSAPGRLFEAGQGHRLGHEKVVEAVMGAAGAAHSQRVPGVFDGDVGLGHGGDQHGWRLARLAFDIGQAGVADHPIGVVDAGAPSPAPVDAPTAVGGGGLTAGGRRSRR